MIAVKRLLLVALVAFAAAAAGVFVARGVIDEQGQSESEIHAMLHRQLDLDAAQSARIDALEARHAGRKTAFERDMRSANAQLAEAIAAEHGNGPRVTAAVDRIHHIMGEMQKEVLEHMFAMRAVLKPDQAAVFDKTVVKALTAEAR